MIGYRPVALALPHVAETCAVTGILARSQESESGIFYLVNGREIAATNKPRRCANTPGRGTRKEP